MKCAIVILRFEHTCYVSKERRGKNRVKTILIGNYIFQLQLLVLLISLIFVSFLIYQIWSLPVLEAKLQKLCKHCEITSFLEDPLWVILFTSRRHYATANHNSTAIFHGLYYTPIESHSQAQSNGIQCGHFFPF